MFRLKKLRRRIKIGKPKKKLASPQNRRVSVRTPNDDTIIQLAYFLSLLLLLLFLLHTLWIMRRSTVFEFLILRALCSVSRHIVASHKTI